jgi:hypothetical protein
MPEISYSKVQEYLTSLVPPREPELQKMEEYAEKNGFPIIGPACGYYCYQLARMINAKSVFELGSGYGYSTAWFAKAVKENGGGVVHHTVWDEDLSKRFSDICPSRQRGVVEFHLLKQCRLFVRQKDRLILSSTTLTRKAILIRFQLSKRNCGMADS